MSGSGDTLGRSRRWPIPGIRAAMLALVVLGGAAAAFLLLRPTTEPEILLPAAPALKEPSDFVNFPEPQPVPDFTFANGSGRRLRLADFRGRVVLLNIWATWCGPCREEMPRLDRLQTERGSPDFTVIALSVDQAPAATVRKFLSEIGIKHLALYIDETGDAAEKLRITGIPATLLIGRDGRALGSMLGAADWASPAAVELVERAIGSAAGRGTGSPQRTEAAQGL